MKKIMIAAALAATALVATPAMAGDFTGPRVELSAGVDDVTKGINSKDVTYGAAVGFDVGIAPRATVGLEANVDNVFDDERTIGASARVGYEVVNGALVYGKVGYTNYRDVFSRKLDGVRVGGGLDVIVTGPFYVGAEYAYTDLQANVGRHEGKVKVGIRF